MIQLIRWTVLSGQTGVELRIRRNGKIIEFTECPYCGGTFYYQKVFISGYSEYHSRFDDQRIFSDLYKHPDNSNLYDGLHVKKQKTVWCESCNKKIGYAED